MGRQTYSINNASIENKTKYSLNDTRLTGKFQFYKR
jgi:hypothetical protein